MSCGFQGNSDIFGIGIRVGYYSQVLAIWVSNYFNIREIKALRAVNNLFLLAVIVAGFIYIFNATGTYAIEAFLLLQIGLIVGLVGITEFTKYSIPFRAVSRERLILRIMIMVIGTFFNLLFWWKGLDYLLPTPCDNTEVPSATYAFFFWKTDIYGWMRTVMKVQSIFAIGFALPFLLSFDFTTLMYDVCMTKARSAFVHAVHTLLLEDGNAFMSVSSLVKSQLQGSRTATDEPSAAVKYPDFKILLKVSEAEDYLDSVYSREDQIPDPLKATMSNPNLSTPFWNPLRLLKSAQLRRLCADTALHLKCVLRSYYGIFTNQPPFTFWSTLSLHETTTGNHAGWRLHRLINRMASLNAARDSPLDWRFFKIASDLALSQIPASTKKRVWYWGAIQQFLLIVFLVFQLEFTIVWNNVHGLQSVSNLGQLIPLIIGVGGLVKVLWGKARMLYEGKDEAGLGAQPPSEYEVAMARYIESKGQTDRQPLPVRVATA